MDQVRADGCFIGGTSEKLLGRASEARGAESTSLAVFRGAGVNTSRVEMETVFLKAIHGRG